MTQSKLTPNTAYARVANSEQIERTVKALEANGIRVLVAENTEEARARFFEVLPAGAEVFTATSRTVEVLGLQAEIDERYDSVRVKLAKLDPKTQSREMVKLGATPEVTVGSVHAVTETGSVVIASATGSQLAGYASAAAKVVWVVGAQKIVPTLEDAMKRIEEYTLPLEDERALQAYGVNSSINKMLIVHREVNPGRITMIIIKDNIGF